MIAGGVVAVVGSFLDGVLATTAWGEGAFPIVSLIPIYSGAVALLVVLSRLGNVRFAPRVMGFAWPQLYFVLGLLAAVMALCWVLAAESNERGLYVMLVGSVLVALGARLSRRGRRHLGLADG
jgi:hypothetical protein